MKKILIPVLALMCGFQPLLAQSEVSKAKFKVGDDPSYADPNLNDGQWQTLDITRTWDSQGIPSQTHLGWYRLHFNLDKAMLDNADMKQLVVFDLGPIDDADETYLNGVLIGKTGIIPDKDNEYSSAWSTHRRYAIPANHKALRWGKDNVVSVRCYSGGEPGGMFDTPAKVYVPSRLDGARMEFTDSKDDKGQNTVTLKLSEIYPVSLKGNLKVELSEFPSGEVVSTVNKTVTVTDKKPVSITLPYTQDKNLMVTATLTDPKTGKQISSQRSLKYILTPAAPETPRFNTAALYGVRPGSPIHYRFGVSGVRPMTFSSADLPAGLTLDPNTGALSGSLKDRGNVTFTVTAKNAKGTASQKFTIAVGDKIALTPPMGWNSWNCWGLSVTQDKVLSSAKALIDKGLADYGYAYINVDDGWEAPERAADGTILVNEKFPDMKALGDGLHAEGLKFGIYSSPGDYTCGGYLGSLNHEKQDAESYNSWGVDYLKYDWCGYSREHAGEADKGTVASYVRPYLEMEEFIREQPRDIFYSLCQYGMADVWKWGEAVDANSWRTTGDIVDTWPSVLDIGFKAQAPLHPYGKPGHWNDPDMLVVGKVGWSNNLRDSRLTPDEQYSHISLWSLLASNMLIGCDLAQLDDFTINLLCNNEVNAVNQDILGKQAQRYVDDGNTQVWARPLADGTYAVGIFNLSDKVANLGLKPYLNQLQALIPGITTDRIATLRDLWRQQDVPAGATWAIPPHGVRLFKLTAK